MRKTTGNNLPPLKFMISSATLRMQFWLAVFVALLLSLYSALTTKKCSQRKQENWWELNPQRGRANNSVVLMRHRIDRDTFMSIWDRVRESGSGEPGFYFSNDKDWGTNPCCEIGLRPYQFCNLTEVNVSDVSEQSGTR